MQSATTSRAALTPQQMNEGHPSEPSNAPSSSQDILAWAMTPDSIATCFIRDVFAMTKNNTSKDPDFYWLGRVPCRSVRVVALVVGVQAFDKRVVYTVDDGTSVIDCVQRVSVAATVTKLGSPPSVKPTYRVGTLIRIVGKVVEKYEARQIMTDTIDRCSSFTAEPKHWQEVRALHSSYYFASGPFSVPRISSKPEFDVVNTENNVFDIPSSPSTAYSIPSSSEPSSPAKPKQKDKSPPKLRHPSRLRSHDLTGNAFRLYVKHYMDYALPLALEKEKEMNLSFQDPYIRPSTPQNSSSYQYLEDRTPRPSKIAITQDLTPTRSTFTDDRVNIDVDVASEFYGYTLSYLRRVPVLSDMARRVVGAEAKRRAKEEHKKAKEAAASKSKTQSQHTTSSAPKSSSSQRSEPTHAKMKRLFQWAIIQLVREGNVVLWDGPVRPVSSAEDSDSSALWKMNSSVSSNPTGPDHSLCSSDGRSLISADEGYLSDPDPEEEAYMSVTPSLMARQVEGTIIALTRPPLKAAASSKAEKQKVALSSLGHIQNAYGVTKEQILAWLRRDDRWQFVGDWSVEDGLKFLADDGRAWNVGSGSWELTS